MTDDDRDEIERLGDAQFSAYERGQIRIALEERRRREWERETERRQKAQSAEHRKAMVQVLTIASITGAMLIAYGQKVLHGIQAALILLITMGKGDGGP